MFIVSMATLPKMIELPLAIYGTVKLLDKIFPKLRLSEFFQSFFD